MGWLYHLLMVVAVRLSWDQLLAAEQSLLAGEAK